MSNRSTEDDNMPAEIDFSNGVRGLHHIPSGAKVFCPLPSSEVFGNTSLVRLNKRESICRSF